MAEAADMSSSAPASSTPPRSDNAIFSDEARRASSPPSSPPGFPWDLQKSPPKAPKRLSTPLTSVFSVLGKRKTLGERNDNARPAKQAKTRKLGATDKQLTQMQLSLGQSTRTTCKTCGMEYIPSSTEDRALHSKYHAQNTAGVDVGKAWMKEARQDALWTGRNSQDVIVAIERKSSKAAQKRAREVLDVVQRELGAVEIKDKELWSETRPGSTAGLDSLQAIMLDQKKVARYEVYIYIRGTKAVGLLLAERIREAHRVEEPPKPTDAAPRTSLQRLKAHKEFLAESRPLEINKGVIPACLGVSRIWCSSQARKQGVATALLDTAAEQFGVGQAGRQQVAFSQPTEAGAALARKWFGRMYGWCVYVA